MTIAVWTVINLAASIFMCFIQLYMSRQYKNLGWQEIRFRVWVERQRGHYGRRACYCCMDIFFRGSVYLMVISGKDYEELSRCSSEKTMAYVREFRKRYFSPGFEKYEFSLHEADWDRKDRKRCLKELIFLFVTLEALTCILILQV
ncbi:MAG TPA: hypothetical protein DCZ91_16590 [Lachnospiraceae bacterium]|nr:hypothetical protein [Lachnospiraceae bacterium]